MLFVARDGAAGHGGVLVGEQVRIQLEVQATRAQEVS
jgi:hypothetical protein